MLASRQLASWHVSATGERVGGAGKTARDGAGVAEPLDRRRLVFGIVSIGLFMGSIDQTIVSTALPAIAHDLHATINWSGWTISVYALGQVIAMPMAGKISDMYGRRKVFVVSTAVFTLASLCCGFAGNMALLLVPRFIQALGGGAFMPSATGIVSDHFGPERDRAVGMFTSILPVGGIVGPVVGGLFVSYWSWRGIFLVNLPIGVVLIALALKFIPASAPRTANRIDIRGIALLAAFIVAGMFGVTYIGSGQVPLYSPVFLGCEAAAAVLLWLFIRHSRRDSAPFVPYRLLRGRGFGVMNLINFVYGAAALGFAALVPLYAQQRFHIAPLGAGTLLTARAVGMIAIAGGAAMALRRTGYRLPMVAGFATLTAGLLMMAVAPPMSAYAWLAIGAAVTGCGMGLAVPAANNASLQLAPDQVAAIAGLRGMFRQSGSIIAVSVATAVIARSSHPGLAQAHMFVAFAVLLVLLLPLVKLVPDHHGNWLGGCSRRRRARRWPSRTARPARAGAPAAPGPAPGRPARAGRAATGGGGSRGRSGTARLRPVRGTGTGRGPRSHATGPDRRRRCRAATHPSTRAPSARRTGRPAWPPTGWPAPGAA
jgi:EmrB/QacA subfamily drug resistance transporter